MLSHEGQRTDRQNRALAGSLAIVAGFVNSSGFLLIGNFTSHATGNIGRMTNDLALGHPSAALLALIMVTAFFAGAFLASMAIEADVFGRRDLTYCALLAGEAVLLLGFFAVARLLPSADPRVHDAQAAVLCAAMGMQNSLVTRLSGAVVRTTHLTGVLTDLGIEAARWFRFARHHVGTYSNLRLTWSDAPPERPHLPKTALLATVLAGFVAGGASGAVLTVWLRHLSLLVPVAGLAALALFALFTSRDIAPEGARK
jgi:uncharacterized membrane protein YoaK (UPF0700 family)